MQNTCLANDKINPYRHSIILEMLDVPAVYVCRHSRDAETCLQRARQQGGLYTGIPATYGMTFSKQLIPCHMNGISHYPLDEGLIYHIQYAVRIILS